MIIASLPLPPSANRLWRSGGRKPYIPPEYVAWKREAGWILAAARLRHIDGPFAVDIGVPAKMLGDIDNRVKALLDLFAEHGVTDNDRNAWRITIERRPAVPKGTCVVSVRPYVVAEQVAA